MFDIIFSENDKPTIDGIIQSCVKTIYTNFFLYY